MEPPQWYSTLVTEPPYGMPAHPWGGRMDISKMEKRLVEIVTDYLGGLSPRFSSFHIVNQSYFNLYKKMRTHRGDGVYSYWANGDLYVLDGYYCDAVRELLLSTGGFVKDEPGYEISLPSGGVAYLRWRAPWRAP